MAEPTRAEMLLDQVTKGNGLISQLEAVKEHPINPVPVKLSPTNKAKIRAFQDNLQQRIDQLTAQREQIKSMVGQIPDGEAQLVLQLRYGLLDNSTKKMPWFDMPPIMNYEMETLYRRHRKGIDYLNTLLENEVEENGAKRNETTCN